jgi:hypothetical protein
LATMRVKIWGKFFHVIRKRNFLVQGPKFNLQYCNTKKKQTDRRSERKTFFFLFFVEFYHSFGLSLNHRLGSACWAFFLVPLLPYRVKKTFYWKPQQGQETGRIREQYI